MSHPTVVRRASYFAAALPFSSNCAVRFAITPTVMPSGDDKGTDLGSRAAEFAAQSSTEAAAARGYIDAVVAPGWSA